MRGRIKTRIDQMMFAAVDIKTANRVDVVDIPVGQRCTIQRCIAEGNAIERLLVLSPAHASNKSLVVEDHPLTTVGQLSVSGRVIHQSGLVNFGILRIHYGCILRPIGVPVRSL